MDVRRVLRELESLGDEGNVEGMARFGIRSKARILGVPKPELRRLARRIGRDHELAIELWESGVHEARILACMVAQPERVDEGLMERWVRDVDNWELCDQCVINLFWRTSLAYRKAIEWSQRREEFVRRAGFALMAKLAISDKKADDAVFESFFPYILEGARDERNYVRKAASWALRRVGKRNLHLNRRAVEVARELGKMDSRSAKLIAREAMKELASEKLQEKIKKKG